MTHLWRALHCRYVWHIKCVTYDYYTYTTRTYSLCTNNDHKKSCHSHMWPHTYLWPALHSHMSSQMWRAPHYHTPHSCVCVTHSRVTPIAWSWLNLTCVTWLIHMCDMTHSYVWHDSFIFVTWLIHICDMTHLYVWPDSFIRVTWLIHTCDMTYSYLRHDHS